MGILRVQLPRVKQNIDAIVYFYVISAGTTPIALQKLSYSSEGTQPSVAMVPFSRY